MRVLKVLGIVLASLLGLVLVVALALHFYDWNKARGMIAEQSAKRFGHELRIAGDLQVKLLRACPSVAADAVSVDKIFDAGHVGVSLCLWPLLKGEVRLRDVELDDAKIVVARGGEAGEAEKEKQKEEKAGKEERTLGKMPVWDSVRLRNVRVDVKGAEGAKDIVLVIDSLDSSRRSQDQPMVATGKGSLQGLPWALDAAVTTNLEFDARMHLAQIAATAKGTIGSLDTLDPLTGELSVDAKNLGEVAAALGMPLAGSTPAVELRTRIERKGQVIRADDLHVATGVSDLGGWVALELAQRPMIRGDLASQRLRVADVTSFAPKSAAAAAKEPARRKAQAEKTGESVRLIPDTPIPTEALRALDLDLKVALKRIEGEGALALIDSLDATVKLAAGRLRLEPLRVGVAGGVVDTKTAVDASNGKTVALDVDLAVRKLDLDRAVRPFLPHFKLANFTEADVVSGALNGSVKLSSEGRSAHALAAAIGGKVGFEVESGSIAWPLVEAVGLDLAEALGSLTHRKAAIKMDCMLAAYDITNGVVETKAFVIGTPDSNVLGKGTVDLGNEKLELEFRALAKDFSLGSANVPIDVTGTFAQPKVRPRAGQLLAKAAAAIGLGVAAGPAAALLPLIEPGTEKSGRCADYRQRIAQVRKEAATGGG